jgi:hypothetical protein
MGISTAINALGNAILQVSTQIRDFLISPLTQLFAITAGIHCTIKDVHGKRCKIKFCTPCLKNRYGERVDELKAAVKLQDNPTHVRDESYVWK